MTRRAKLIGERIVLCPACGGNTLIYWEPCTHFHAAQVVEDDGEITSGDYLWDVTSLEGEGGGCDDVSPYITCSNPECGGYWDKEGVGAVWPEEIQQALHQVR